MQWRIPLFKMFWDDSDLQSIARTLTRGSHWASGPEIQTFEEMISRYIGSKHAITFSSGTSALHALLLAHGIGEGDEVIVPSFTFIATANAPLFVGAKPVFADIEGGTFGLDPEDVKERITRKTKAIVPIHYGGCPCRIHELREIADDHNLLLIEDAAESLGARSKDQKVGTFGNSTVLSFCQNKVITTGEGGAVVTDSYDIHQKLLLIRSHGRQESSDYFSSSDSAEYVTLGYNLRMSSLTAALGISQIKKIDTVIEMRRDLARSMTNALSDLEGVIVPDPPPDAFHVYQMYTVRVEENARDKLMRHFSTRGIMTKVYFPPVHLTQFFRDGFGYSGGELPQTERISREVLSLPLYPGLSHDEADFIVDTLAEFVGGDDG